MEHGTWNMEHGTFRNIPEHRIIIIITEKICKNKILKKLRQTKNKLVSARKIETKQKHKKRKKRKKNESYYNDRRLATKKSNPFLPVVHRQFNHVTVLYSQISFFTGN